MAPLTAKQLAESTDRWLFKVEPEPRYEDGVDVSLSVETLATLPDQTTHWDGVRNAQASGFMRHRMRVGHKGLLYYSNTKVPGVVATVQVVREGYPDHTAPEEPGKARWYMVDVRLCERLDHYVPLWLLKMLSDPHGLTEEQRSDLAYLTDEQLASISHMPLVQPGRLSVQPVPPPAYETVLLLGAHGGFTSSHWPVAKDSLPKPASNAIGTSTTPTPASAPDAAAKRKRGNSLHAKREEASGKKVKPKRSRSPPPPTPTKPAPRRSSRVAKKQA